MKPHQTINHYLGTYTIARKNNLGNGNNLTRMKKHFPSIFNFFPSTWLMPSDYNDFKQHSAQHRGEAVYIVKPENSCQGKGSS